MSCNRVDCNLVLINCKSINYIYNYLVNKYKIDPFIVYGGSVRDNIKEVLEIKNIKGVMIGKISSDIKEITKILSNI